MANSRVPSVWPIQSILILLALATLWAPGGLRGRPRAPGGDQPSQHTWRLGQAVVYENMAIFPVVSSQSFDTDNFTTLDEALASGDALITEQGSYLRRTREGVPLPSYVPGPQVNQLVLVNRGKRQLILLAGEVVSGGKQDRIIGKDRIVPAGAAPVPLDVFCVEHGRWTGDSANFKAAKLMVHPEVRKEAAIAQDQDKVWAAVRGQSTRANGPASGTAAALGGTLGSDSVSPAAAPRISAQALESLIVSQAPSQDYVKIYKSSPIETSVEAFAQEMQRRFQRATQGLKSEHVVGVVVAYGGEVVWSDIFASPQLFDVYWPKLLRSYVVEALTRPGITRTASPEDARDFLRPSPGHLREESDPGVYVWSEQTEGRITSIELESLGPKQMTLHWLKVATS